MFCFFSRKKNKDANLYLSTFLFSPLLCVTSYHSMIATHKTSRWDVISTLPDFARKEAKEIKTQKSYSPFASSREDYIALSSSSKKRPDEM